ncbi:uncharacterized protein SOCEGT47_079310 [Sorangium cellulosum]|uniref:Uncharacterized protein n=1 Tax=Sorangium cellulosum TaxID=56 RepID=A0A4P2QDV3_SORCE|nr:uncharacterized protein SOCEGT47_079310 [Sorangium cellulosum]
MRTAHLAPSRGSCRHAGLPSAASSRSAPITASRGTAVKRLSHPSRATFSEGARRSGARNSVRRPLRREPARASPHGRIHEKWRPLNGMQNSENRAPDGPRLAGAHVAEALGWPRRRSRCEHRRSSASPGRKPAVARWRRTQAMERWPRGRRGAIEDVQAAGLAGPRRGGPTRDRAPSLPERASRSAAVEGQNGRHVAVKGSAGARRMQPHAPVGSGRTRRPRVRVDEATPARVGPRISAALRVARAHSA